MLTGKKKKLALSGLVVVLVGAVIAVSGAAWYFSNVLEDDGLRIDHSDGAFTASVVGVEGSGLGQTITLLADTLDGDALADLLRYELLGIESESAVARLTEPVSNDGTTVVRSLTAKEGSFQSGDRVRLDRDYVDPFADPAGTYETIELEGPLGLLPAWGAVPADSDAASITDAPGSDWAILVHGRTGTREEALRALQIASKAGYAALAVSYRNDRETAQDPSGYYQFGITEWEDIEPAVRFAVDHGARNLVLIGFSMGGGIVVNFMYRSELAEHVDALALDAPMLDFSRTVDLGAQERSVPGVVTGLAKWLAARRFGVNWREMDYLSRVDQLDVPVLLIHGDDDGVVPVNTSREFARKRPDIVQYEEFPDAGHVASWNRDPARYDRVLSQFLADR